jgi:hypothetical protein
MTKAFNFLLESFEPYHTGSSFESEPAQAAATKASQKLLDALEGLGDGELEDWKLLEYLTLTEIDENEHLRTI